MAANVPMAGRSPFYLPFLLRACVSADAAAVFSSADDLGFLRTFDAAEAALAEVCSLSCFRMDFLPAIRTSPEVLLEGRVCIGLALDP